VNRDDDAFATRAHISVEKWESTQVSASLMERKTLTACGGGFSQLSAVSTPLTRLELPTMPDARKFLRTFASCSVYIFAIERRWSGSGIAPPRVSLIRPNGPDSISSTMRVINWFQSAWV